MKHIAFAAAILLAAAPVAVGAQAASYPSYRGVWKLNEAESQYPAGLPEMNDHVITVTKDDGVNLAYSDSLTVGGKPMSAAFDGVYGGKPATMSTGQITRVYHDANGFHDKWEGADGSSGTDKCVFTRDGRRMNCVAQFKGKGQEAMMEAHEVWERQ
jgi:hypothetical protein